jgi:hypothetical protein
VSEVGNAGKASAPLKNTDTNYEPLSPELRLSEPVSLAGTGTTITSAHHRLDLIEQPSRQLRVVVFPRLHPYKVERIGTIREAVTFFLQMCEVRPIITFCMPLFNQWSYSSFHLCMTPKSPPTGMACITT